MMLSARVTLASKYTAGEIVRYPMRYLVRGDGFSSASASACSSACDAINDLARHETF